MTHDACFKIYIISYLKVSSEILQNKTSHLISNIFMHSLLMLHKIINSKGNFLFAILQIKFNLIIDAFNQTFTNENIMTTKQHIDLISIL